VRVILAEDGNESFYSVPALETPAKVFHDISEECHNLQEIYVSILSILSKHYGIRLAAPNAIEIHRCYLIYLEAIKRTNIHHHADAQDTAHDEAQTTDVYIVNENDKNIPDGPSLLQPRILRDKSCIQRRRYNPSR